MLRASVAGAALAVAISLGPARVLSQEQGVRFDFQDVDIRIVISALAEAGNFNVVYADLPRRSVTLRMTQPVPREGILDLLRSITAANGLRIVEEGTLLRIESGAPAAVLTGLTDTSAVLPETRLFVFRLKHARSGRMAATLQAIFGGDRSAGRMLGGGRQSLSQQLRRQRVPALLPESLPGPQVAVELGEIQQPSLPGQLRAAVQIVPDEATNSLLVRAAAEDWEIVRQAVQALDLRPLQVLIEVQIAEVRRTKSLDVGLSGVFSYEEQSTGNKVEGELKGRTTGDFALSVMRLGKIDVTAALSALAASGEVRILSRPVIVAQNNQEARILIGAERPFIQVFRSLPTEAAVRDQVIQYRDVGTSLTIIPTINDDGYVNLQVAQEVSTATAETQFGAPIISTREASTHLFVRDGQTVVIGGLIEQQEDRRRTGIPLLKDIPVLGLVFGSTQRATTQSELFLFITPHVIASDDAAEEARERLQAQLEWLGRTLIRIPQ